MESRFWQSRNREPETIPANMHLVTMLAKGVDDRELSAPDELWLCTLSPLYLGWDSRQGVLLGLARGNRQPFNPASENNDINSGGRREEGSWTKSIIGQS
jgi:hypothetical protein